MTQRRRNPNQGTANKRKRLRRERSSPLDQAVAARDSATLAMVRDAIQHKEVALAFQQIVRSSPPVRPMFYEALIRVQDETGRVIPAKDFIMSVQDNETGRELDCLALEMGLKELRQTPELVLSINMSARSIGYRKWNKILQRSLDRDSTLADRLILEISEPSAMQVPELVMDFMDDLQARGICFALDDYASNLTSFRYFKDFFFDYVKVDRAFTRDIHKDPENQVLAGAMANIARQFDIFTVATHVQTIQEARTLKNLGFDCLQGYLFGPPTVSPPWRETENSKKAA